MHLVRAVDSEGRTGVPRCGQAVATPARRVNLSRAREGWRGEGVGWRVEQRRQVVVRDGSGEIKASGLVVRDEETTADRRCSSRPFAPSRGRLAIITTRPLPPPSSSYPFSVPLSLCAPTVNRNNARAGASRFKIFAVAAYTFAGKIIARNYSPHVTQGGIIRRNNVRPGRAATRSQKSFGSLVPAGFPFRAVTSI